MMPKILVSFRASTYTTKQIDDLIVKTGMLQTEIITVAIDRMYREIIGVAAPEPSPVLNPAPDSRGEE